MIRSRRRKKENIKRNMSRNKIINRICKIDKIKYKLKKIINIILINKISIQYLLIIII
jgi:hypothetical protein